MEHFHSFRIEHSQQLALIVTIQVKIENLQYDILDYIRYNL